MHSTQRGGSHSPRLSTFRRSESAVSWYIFSHSDNCTARKNMESPGSRQKENTTQTGLPAGSMGTQKWKRVLKSCWMHSMLPHWMKKGYFRDQIQDQREWGRYPRGRKWATNILAHFGDCLRDCVLFFLWLLQFGLNYSRCVCHQLGTVLQSHVEIQHLLVHKIL